MRGAQQAAAAAQWKLMTPAQLRTDSSLDHACHGLPQLPSI